LRTSLSIYAYFIAALIFNSHAYAGAWTQKKGQGLFILGSSYYRAEDFVNNFGKRQSQPRYQKFEINPYVEYGLTDSVTLGANLSLQYTRQNSSSTFTQQITPFTTLTTTINGAYNNAGIGDSEFFVRKRLYQKDGFVLSAEPMVKLPSPYSYMRLPDIGSTHPDAGLTLAGGYGFSAYGQNHFINVDTGYRHRLGNPKDQIRASVTVGIGLDPDWMVMPQLFVTQRTSSPSQVVGFSQSPVNDYNNSKAQLSLIYTMWDNTSVQVGGFYDLSSRNSSTGEGVLVALWRHF